MICSWSTNNHFSVIFDIVVFFLILAPAGGLNLAGPNQISFLTLWGKTNLQKKRKKKKKKNKKKDKGVGGICAT